MSDLYRVTSTLTSVWVNGTATYRHYFDLGGGTAAQAVNATQAFWTALIGNLNGQTDVVINGQVEQMSDIDGSISNAYSTAGGSATRSASGSAMAKATCLLLQWRTGAYFSTAPGRGRRELRGRMYVPCIPQTAGVAGKPLAALVTAGTTCANLMVSDANSVFSIWRRPVRDATGAITRDGDSAPAAAGGAWTEFAQMRSFRD